ncbi:ROK family transcriptional regulator [Streptomyces sp. SKN60]|uniref:ROK family transcriptional regulator n=1 Tax=Streptomyces sp. SKN60 TaxID=2855506 RepID=UPI002245B3CE|nr:ROK family transcriptional regulator [Streptomyces sp. SKN60]MCX2185714.1 ROK family transcriptional regulator [Streptomyces sp. SKN60]
MNRDKGSDGGAGRGPGGGAGVNLPALRSHNAALVLDLLRTAGEGGVSRLELAERTGLTPQAVSKITARLRAEGLAAEAGRRASTGGKPATVLRLVPSAAYAIGLHLDRDELTAVLLDLAGERVAERRAPLDLGAGAEAVLAVAGAAVAALLGAEGGYLGEGGAVGAGRGHAAAPGRAPVAGRLPEAGAGAGAGGVSEPEGEGSRPTRLPLLGVGVAMPGPLDHRSGRPGRVTGFPEWDGFPLREELARWLGWPVALDKDTNAAALGLALRPGAPGSFAYVHLGTGLGAGLVLGGAVLRGGRTGAGELGHQTVQLDGPACDCGGRGCLEVLCLAALARGDLPEAARVLGTGAANLVRLLDIDRVLLGGRAVLAAPAVFAHGTRELLTALGLPATVEIATGTTTVADGAAQLILAPVFGKQDTTGTKIR